MHNIQNSILDQLMQSETKRFSELRPKRVDSNLFQYHLKAVIQDGLVEKVSSGYQLSAKGMYYADRYSALLKTERPQPKIITITIVRNSQGLVLLQQKLKQPFIGTYHLPAGKIHEEEAIINAAQRELAEKTGLLLESFAFQTAVHVRIRSNKELVSEYYSYVLLVEHTSHIDGCVWYDPALEEPAISLAPSVREVLEVGISGDKSFHEIEVTI